MKFNRSSALLVCAFLGHALKGGAQEGPVQPIIGESLLTLAAPASGNSQLPGLSAGQAAVWEGMESTWYNTGDGRYFKEIVRGVTDELGADGSLPVYSAADVATGHIISGHALLLAYKVLNQEKYYKAAGALYNQLAGLLEGKGPIASEGLYMSLPFALEYASLVHDNAALTGFAGRVPALAGKIPAGDIKALGWYGLSLLDALEFIPEGTADRKTVLALFGKYAEVVRKLKDKAADPALVYILAKGARLGYLPASDREMARNAYSKLPAPAAAGDPGELGLRLLAAGEIDVIPGLALGKGRTVMLDYYFNNEHKKDITGATVRYHYTWEDESNSGFSMFGHIFRNYGLRTDSLPVAPDAANLKKASVYIIVDPDNELESPHPHFMDADAADRIYEWVKAGGILVLMSNDSGNAEFHHFNVLPERFGIHYNEDSRNKVTGNQYEMGAFRLDGSEGIFKHAKKVYIKELSTLKISGPAKSYLADKGDVIIAVAKVGKGAVFAVGDPWFYNEYADGRKLPAAYDNYGAAKDLVRWLIAQIPE